MRKLTSRFGMAILGAVAIAGSQAGRALVSLLVADPHRGLVGASTGSARVLAGAGVALFVCAVALSSLRVVATGAVTRFREIAALLVATQAAAYVAQEVAERGFHVLNTMAEPVVVLGIVVQVLLALVAALLLSGFERAVRAVVSRRPRPRRSQGEPAPAARGGAGLTRPVFANDAPGRAPPLRRAA